MIQTKGHSRAAYRALWQQRIQAWQHSGLSKAEFARQQGYSESQLGNWIARLRKASPTPSATASAAANNLIPIQVIASTARMPQMRISYQQCQCDFFSLPDPQWLAECLQALQS